MSDKPTISSFEAIFDASPMSIIIVQDLTKVVYCNKTFIEVSGYSSEDVQEMEILDFVHKDDIVLIKDRQKILLEGEEPERRFTMRFMHKDGSIILTQVTGDNIIYNGKPARIMTGANISAQPLSDQSPELVSALLDALTHHTELGFWVDDLDDHTMYINERLCEVLGYTYDEIKDKSVTDFLDPVSHESYLQSIENRKKGTPTSSYELILIDRLGRPNTFRVIGSTLYDSNNQPMASVGFFANIEPMKKLSTIVSTLNKYALYSRYKDLSSFWNKVVDDVLSIFYSDHGMVFLDNEVLAKKGEFALNFSPTDVLEDLTKKGDIVSCLDTDCSHFFDGAQSVLLATMFLNQQPAGFILIGSDIENLYLPQDVDLFMTFANQITMNYEHHFLYIESEEEREYVSILLDILSHDFLNANTSVHGYLELLDQGLDTQNVEKFKEFLSRSINVVERSERILQTVQQLTKIQKERQAKRTLPLRPILENAIELQKTMFYPRKIDVTFECPKKTNVIAGDLLQNVFENVINNAVKYTEDQDVKLDIDCISVEIEESKLMEIRFTDYGMGIPDDIKPRFFRRLTRGDHRFQEGSGLGLYLARVILDTYNGEIRFSNRVPDDYTKGTVVIIQIPEG
ncbi:MAG: PAS domain S-box protein [Candidatus Heimdallarchaeota archaeon]|nr:PAS domain S-box protein [Candidatus Heimdallarchaeota archaeon]MCK4770047.1 PAS domain S-box protein [Candidatus Heimdallarchaeota archaeon]